MNETRWKWCMCTVSDAPEMVPNTATIAADRISSALNRDRARITVICRLCVNIWACIWILQHETSYLLQQRFWQMLSKPWLLRRRNNLKRFEKYPMHTLIKMKMRWITEYFKTVNEYEYKILKHRTSSSRKFIVLLYFLII